jgi:hypothetical protein
MIGYAFGITAPVISSQSGTAGTSVPIWISGALFLVTGLIMFALPYETANEERL